MVITTLKAVIKATLQKTAAIFLPDLNIDKKFTYDLLGHEDGHYFVGYYDKDPISHTGSHVLCHKVSFKYENMIEPESADIGLLCLTDNSFHQLTKTKAMNWQLGSRAQWLGQDIIIYNDIIKGKQCSVKFNCSTKEPLFVYKRPFWDVSHDKKFGASLNFSRIKIMRPGYGYDGINVDRDKEVLTVFSLEDDSLVCEIGLDEILKKVDSINVSNQDAYLNHIVWSHCSTKLITCFHCEDQYTKKRSVFPVLIDISTGGIELIFDGGNFSHHTFMDERRILAYLRFANDFCFAIWSKEDGWVPIKGPMPVLDGHPTYIASENRIIVDSYPNRLGIMSLYLGSPNSSDTLDRIASVLNPPKYQGPLRCDLHPRVSQKHSSIVCDIPYKNGRKILVIKGALDV
ncbi:hypothetical protein N8291_06520 [Pseudomonadales bacterium]|nr:hypothetical protein [Pseudomonadales bacterium]